MGLTIHWSFQGPQKKSEATAIIEKLREKAMDLPFESVGEIVHFQGKARPIRQRSARQRVSFGSKSRPEKPSGPKMAGSAGTVRPRRSSVSRSTLPPAASGWNSSWQRIPRPS